MAAGRDFGEGQVDEVSAHPILPIPDDYQAYPHSIAEATRLSAPGRRGRAVCHSHGTPLLHRAHPAVGDGGYPVLNVVRKLVDGPLVWAPAVNGAVVLEASRGGDFE